MATDAPTFEHKGTKIELTKFGTFAAKINGKHVSKPSLDAMRKAIDEVGKLPFTPFVAVRAPTYQDGAAEKAGAKDGLLRVQIIGVQKADRGARYRGEFMFIEKGGAEAHKVMVDSPENRAAFKALRDFKAEAERIKAERDEQERLLLAAIEYHVADDYIAAGGGK